MTAYEDVLGWLYGLEAAKGMDFKLERVELALASLGDPQRAYPTLHIAGTNGKGSVAAMTHAVLGAAGYRTGLYTSPHLVRFTERVRIGDRLIGEDEVVALVEEIRATATSRGIDLTFFEFTTVLAFLYFMRQGADAAVIEVGLGGRLDATNVIEPEVAVVTNIGLDHQEWLGESLEEIAGEKGGILKAGRPAVFGRLRPAAERVLAGMARERGCPVIQLDRDFSLRGDPPCYRGPGWQLDELRLPLRGLHQRDNAAVALAALEQLSARLRVDEASVRLGLAQARWPGRLEVVHERPLVVLDGAHNADGVAALVQDLGLLAAGRRVHLLFAVMQDKIWQPMVERLAEVVDDVVVTSVAPPRGEAAARLAEAFSARRPTRIADDAAAALANMVEESAPDDVVLVAGSLFLVGAVHPTVERLQARAAASGCAEVARG